MASVVNKNAHPDSVNTMYNPDALPIPQSRKDMSLSECYEFLNQVMTIFKTVEDMSSLRITFETGKQLSRLYFDAPDHRVEIANALNNKHEFPSFASKMMKKLNNMGVFKNDDIWFSSFYFYNITWNFSDCSPGFATSLGHSGLPNLLNLNIGHQPYLDNLSSKNVYYLMKASLSLMHNISRVPGNAHFFADDTVKTSLAYLTQREEEFLKCVATLTLAYILTEKDCCSTSPIVTSNTSIVTDVVSKLSNFIQYAIKSEKRRYHGFTIEELLAALASLAVNDSAKQMIALNPANGIFLLRNLLSQNTTTVNNALETEYSCRTLWNLAFDNDLRKRMIGDEFQLVPLLSQLKLTHASPTVCKMAEGVLWVLAEEGRRLDTIKRSSSLTLPVPLNNSTRKSDVYVFISYSWSDKDTVLRLQEKLRDNSLSFWIDVEQLSDVNLPSVARAIEQSKAVLLCMSEGYRVSPNCRTEANYAQSLRKPIISAIMQARYKVEPWLSQYLDTSTHFDFGSRRNFDASFEQLAVVLRNLLSVSSVYGGDSGPGSPAQMSPTLHPNHSGTSSHCNTTSKQHTSSHYNSRNNIHDSATKPPTDKRYICSSSNNTSGPTATVQPLACRHPATVLEGLCEFSISPHVFSWSKSDVSAWLDAHQLSGVKPQMANMDGKLLAQMFQVRREAPEFFYRCLDTKMGFHFVDILRFSDAILSLTK